MIQASNTFDSHCLPPTGNFLIAQARAATPIQQPMALCPDSLKSVIFFKAPPSDKHSLLRLANWPSALWLAEHHKHALEM